MERELATKEGVQAAWMVTEDPLVAALSVRVHVRCAGVEVFALSFGRCQMATSRMAPMDLDIEELPIPVRHALEPNVS